jgi:predicted nucleic acid-binding Zn ribbon protein
MREQDPKSKFSLGSEVLQRLFESGNSPLSEQFMRWKLWARWSEFVGPTIAQNTEPVGLNRGVLYLWVRSSSWMQQLTFMKDPIQDTLNKKLGQHLIKNIRFTLDRREVPSDVQAQRDFKNVISKIVPESDDD